MAGPYISSGAFAQPVTENSTTIRDELGILRFEGGKIYRYVLCTAASIAAGEAVIQSGTGGTTVVKSTAVTTAAGQCVTGIAETAFVTSSYGWITVHGLVSAALVDTTAVAGAALQAGSTAGTLAPSLVIGAATTTGVMNSNKVVTALTTGVITGSAVFIRAL